MINTLSTDWCHVEKWAKVEMEELIEVLISTESAEIRGRIKQLQDLLSLPNISPIQ